jgi:hypothetical protein
MMTEVLDQALDLGTVIEVTFESGEPFLFYPLMIEGIRRRRVAVRPCRRASGSP